MGIHEMDCLEYLGGVGDGEYDLVVTSPPYNMGETGGCVGDKSQREFGRKFYVGDFDDRRGDYEDWYMAVLGECIRVSRYVAWNVQWVNSTKRVVARMQYELVDELKEIFIWKKHAQNAIQGHRGHFSRGFEFVYLFGEGDGGCFRYNNFPENGYVPNVMEWSNQNSKRRFSNHFATFPIELPMYFIERLTKPGDVVCDPMCGTGTTGVAAKRLGRRYELVDMVGEYCELACEEVCNEPAPLF